MPEFIWTPDRTEAAELLARETLSKQEIADKVGVTRMTLYRWLEDDTFKNRVAEATAEFGAEVRQIGIASQVNRLATLDWLLRSHKKLISDRADSEEMKGVPGGSTGLLVRDLKRVTVETDGEDRTSTTEVAVYRYDPGPPREIRELMKHAAIELGQWEAKSDSNEADIRAATTQAASKAFDEQDDDGIEV